MQRPDNSAGAGTDFTIRGQQGDTASNGGDLVLRSGAAGAGLVTSGTMQASLRLADAASDQDDTYNGMTIVTGGDVVATGTITAYTGATRTIVVTWSACTETGTVCDDTDNVTPTMTTSTTYTVGFVGGDVVLKGRRRRGRRGQWQTGPVWGHR